MRAKLLFAVVLCVPCLCAAAPTPVRAVDLPMFMGRWYELMRIPNGAERNCHAVHQDWSLVASDRVMILQTCHEGSDDGPARVVRTPARVIDAVSHASFEASFFGGLLHRRYLVLDHADDYAWMIASTDDGRFASILARRAEIPLAELARLKARAGALGLDAAKLVFAGRAPR